MTKQVVFASLAAVGLLGLAVVVGAQGPGPRGRFGHRGPEGPGGPGGWGHGIRACSQNQSCIPYQFNWTRTITRPVLTSPTAASPQTVTTTGVLAGDKYGSTYYEVTITPQGPWASKVGPQEFIYVRDFDTMLGYIQNVTKNTYQKFTIQEHTPANKKGQNPNWKGPGSGSGGGSGKGPTITKTSANGQAFGGYTCVSGETTTITGPDTTTTRTYCADLRIVVAESSTGPRSSSTYSLSGYTSTLSGTLPFSPSGTLEPGPEFGHHGHRPGGGPGFHNAPSGGPQT